jgi:hypothetical protein
MEEGRYRTVKALIPPEKADVLSRFLSARGINLGTLLEAFADLIAEVGIDAPAEAFIGRTDQLLTRAQDLTLERARRRRHRPEE